MLTLEGTILFFSMISVTDVGPLATSKMKLFVTIVDDFMLTTVTKSFILDVARFLGLLLHFCIAFFIFQVCNCAEKHFECV